MKTVKSTWKLSAVGCVVIVFFIISIIVIIAGIVILVNVNHDIKKGVNEAEDVITHNDDPHDNKMPKAYTINAGKAGDYSDAIAILTFIDDKNAKVGIFNGITNDILRKGAGRDTNTALPNESGNCVLYAHRDSGFASLTTIKINDCISLQTKQSTLTYHVTDVRITTPNDPSIYAKTDEKQVTLVTCYPFSYVGPAPQRCVVTADADKTGQ